MGAKKNSSKSTSKRARKKILLGNLKGRSEGKREADEDSKSSMSSIIERDWEDDEPRMVALDLTWMKIILMEMLPLL